VLATLEEQRVAVLFYPTLRRKPALIGEAQIGSTCQLSAATGLPAISVPAGFSTDGVPIGMEFMGGAFAEAPLLRLAYAWEQKTHPRLAPFSTPPLVNGAGPLPIRIETVIKGSSTAAARVMFNYDRTTGVARFDASTSGLVDDRVIGLTLQRTRRRETRADRGAPVGARPGFGDRAPSPYAGGRVKTSSPARCTCTSIHSANRSASAVRASSFSRGLMQLGMIGLGRMGANMVRRLMRAGHTAVVHDRSAAAVEALVKEGATGALDVAAFIGKLDRPRTIFLMLPAPSWTRPSTVSPQCSTATT
jgi:hypothetical protein